MATFELRQVAKSFPDGEAEIRVLKGIDLTLAEGQLTALVGSSGSGKSTLLTIAAGLQEASGGEILLDGEDMTKMPPEKLRSIRATRFGFVFQSSHLVPFLTAEDQLALMLDVSGSRLDAAGRAKQVAEALGLVGMEHRRKAYPASLSGGEKQRIAIARAIIHRPRILFADEPTASLDSERSHEILGLLRKLTQAFGMSTLMVTHDGEMLPYADRVVEMRDGRIEGHTWRTANGIGT
ncbi:ABC transporter ATP-binding protein [Cohnella fermenti]|uniref:ABC transporter ATP-binding protein n=1 Tax=Cohnella fermenti TaxID=2565925 RepID=A0A4S4C3N8_9BACL|nr:ABC transporter ATP-binding protein [Cohnella fermenti]THF81710.1 ABC transporter ATP-binding protein [Cohnella fermenti]